jgi:cytochrome c peroxidase
MRNEKLRDQTKGLTVALMLIGFSACGSKSNPTAGSGSDVETTTGLLTHAKGGVPAFTTKTGAFGTVMQAAGPAPRALAAIPPDPVTSDPNINLLLQCGSHPHSCFNNDNPFFLSLGRNGRRCVSCHWPSAEMTVGPSQLQALANVDNVGIIPDSLGLGAIFRAFDGANSPIDPNANSTVFAQRQAAYSLLLAKGLIRIGTEPPLNGGLPLAASFQFTITNVQDPYGYGSSCVNPLNCLDFKRRPIPLLSMRDIVTIMWDGRESPSQVGCTANGLSLNPVLPPCKVGQQSLTMDFGHQASGATQGHAQSTLPLTTVQMQEILNFQFQIAVAQIHDNLAGDLTINGARGGPSAMLSLPMFVGLNDNFGNCADELCKVVGAPLAIGFRDKPFNTNVFSIYNTYSLTPANAQQSSIARGQAIFNQTCSPPVNCTIPIGDVNGINDQKAFCDLISQPVPCGAINGGCVTCHDNPNIGNHTVARQLNIGLAHVPEFMTNDLPTYTFTCNATGNAARIASGGTTGCTLGGPSCTGQMLVPSCGSVQAQDGGKGMISGLFSEVGMFKGAHLRGLAGRDPFFHNGFGTDLLTVVQFYEDRFSFVFDTSTPTPRLLGCNSPTPPQATPVCSTSPPSPSETDLVNFLQAL